MVSPRPEIVFKKVISVVHRPTIAKCGGCEQGEPRRNGSFDLAAFKKLVPVFMMNFLILLKTIQFGDIYPQPY
jgi:hypothetical protein